MLGLADELKGQFDRFDATKGWKDEIGTQIKRRKYLRLHGEYKLFLQSAFWLKVLKKLREKGQIDNNVSPMTELK